MNALHITGLSIRFGIETGFLVIALWIMIKLQKLNYNFLGLLGAAALSIVLEMALDPFLGVYFSTPIVVAVLLFCMWKVTRADSTDVVFTVAVGYALTFCMDLFLMGALMGDLRVSARTPMTTPAEEKATNEAAATTHAPVPVNHPAVATVGTNAPPAEPLSKSFSVRGVTRNAGRSSVVIVAGPKQYTLFAGDMVMMKTARGAVAVQFKSLEGDQVVLNVEGEEVRLPAE